jgi:hypothetical protein
LDQVRQRGSLRLSLSKLNKKLLPSSKKQRMLLSVKKLSVVRKLSKATSKLQFPRALLVAA